MHANYQEQEYGNRAESYTVQFIQCFSEEMHHYISESSIDVVFCNSALWQMKLATTLTAIHTILKPQGRFIFSFPANVRTPQPEPPFAHTLAQIMLKIAEEKYGYTSPYVFPSEGQPHPTLQEILSRYSFKVLALEMLEIARTPDDIYAFFKIPVMSLRYLPDLDYTTRIEIIEKAYQRCTSTPVSITTWRCYVAEKR